MTHSGTRSRFDASVGFLSIALVFGVGPGCVTSSTHERVVDQHRALQVANRELEEQVRLLRIANRSLDDNVANLISEREDLLEAREDLSTRLNTTQAHEEALASRLELREAELEVTAAALVSQSRVVGELQGTYEGLLGDLEEEVAKGQVQISQLRDGLRVGVAQEILFASGSADLSPQGEEVLQTVTQRFAGADYSIAVEGYTDNLPISGALRKRYPSKWDLAGARAAQVVRLFVSGGIDAQRLTAVSRGATHPVADNGTAEGRARNRRIEIRLRPLAEDEAGLGGGS